mgnify:CR=1 FL=1
MLYFQKSHKHNSPKMISDIQLAMFANIIGILLFLLVVLYHFIQANY